MRTKLFLYGIVILIITIIVIGTSIYPPNQPNQSSVSILPTSKHKPTPTKTRWPTADRSITRTPGSYYRTKTAEANKSNESILDQFSNEAFESAPSCQHWRYITLEHVGQTICVRGTVKNTWSDPNQNAFFMTFSTDPNDFYMILYDGYYYENVKDHCIYIEGSIQKLGQAPVLVIPQGGILYKCDPFEP